MSKYTISAFSFSKSLNVDLHANTVCESVSVAMKMIQDGFDKVTIYDKNGRVERIYYNVNGKPRRWKLEQ